MRQIFVSLFPHVLFLLILSEISKKAQKQKTHKETSIALAWVNTNSISKCLHAPPVLYHVNIPKP